MSARELLPAFFLTTMTFAAARPHGISGCSEERNEGLAAKPWAVLKGYGAPLLEGGIGSTVALSHGGSVLQSEKPQRC